MKKAIQRVIKDASGKSRVVYIDPVTLKEIKDIRGYDVINKKNPIVETVKNVEYPNEYNPADQGDRGIAADRSERLGQWKEGLMHPLDRAPLMPGDLSDKAMAKDARKFEAEVAQGSTPKGKFDRQLNSMDRVAKEARNNAPQKAADAFNANFTRPEGPVGNNTAKGVINAPVADDNRPKGFASSGPTTTKNKTAPTDNKAGFMASFGTHRPNMPKDEITDKVRMAANMVSPGSTVVGISGTEDEGEQYGSNRHKTGKAMDFDVYDANGKKITDKDTLHNIGLAAAEVGVQGIGIGKEYMGEGRFHMDTVSPETYEPGQDSGWGSLGNKWQGEFDKVRTPGELPDSTMLGQPTARPENTNVANTGFGSSLTGMENTAKGMIDKAKTPGALDPTVAQDVSNMSPASMAALGIGPVNRTPQERDLMSKVFSGELGSKSLKGLAAGDPAALKELHDMVATAENRATTKKSFNDVFAGSQYNSMLKEKLNTTLSNFDQYGSVVRQAIDQFYDPTTNAMNTPNATNYHATNMKNPPNWSNVMDDPTVAGQHKFGILNGPYDNPLSGDFKAERSRMADAQKNDPGGFTGHKDYAGGGYSSNYDSPSEGGSRFGGSGLGYSGKGGSDSPSEGGSRFGGSGLGNAGTGAVGSGGNFGRGDTPSSGKSSFGEKDKDKDKSKGPSGGGYGGWGGPH